MISDSVTLNNIFQLTFFKLASKCLDDWHNFFFFLFVIDSLCWDDDDDVIGLHSSAAASEPSGPAALAHTVFSFVLFIYADQETMLCILNTGAHRRHLTPAACQMPFQSLSCPLSHYSRLIMSCNTDPVIAA